MEPMETPSTLQARKQTCFLTDSYGGHGTSTLFFKSGFHLRILFFFSWAGKPCCRNLDPQMAQMTQISLL